MVIMCFFETSTTIIIQKEHAIVEIVQLCKFQKSASKMGYNAFIQWPIIWTTESNLWKKKHTYTDL